jgi:Arc/MetJ family transcription regulator
MKANIEIDDKLMCEAMRSAETKTKRAMVEHKGYAF